MSCVNELANEWARCSGKNASYITIDVITPWVKKTKTKTKTEEIKEGRKAGMASKTKPPLHPLPA